MLFLHAASHDILVVVLQNQRVHKQDGNNGDDDRGILQGGVVQLSQSVVVHQILGADQSGYERRIRI